MTDAAATPRTPKNMENIQKRMPKCLFLKRKCSKITSWNLIFSPIRFWSQNGTTTQISNLDVFLECLLEGVLEGFGSQIEAKTIQNVTKNECKIDKSRPPKNAKKYNRNIQEKSMEISSSNKNVENVET